MSVTQLKISSGDEKRRTTVRHGDDEAYDKQNRQGDDKAYDERRNTQMKIERLPYMWDRSSDNYERRTRTIELHVWTWIHQFCLSQIPMEKKARITVLYVI